MRSQKLVQVPGAVGCPLDIDHDSGQVYSHQVMMLQELHFSGYGIMIVQ